MHSAKKYSEKSDTTPMVEVVDAKNTPLGIMPLTEVRRQGLLYRMVQVLIYDRKNRVCLRKRNNAGEDEYPGRWDMSIQTPLHAGKSSMDTAYDAVREQIGTCRAELSFLYTLPPAIETGHTFSDLYRLDRFTPQLPANAPAQTMFVDRDELSGLIRHFPEHVTPHLVYLWNQGMMFTQN